VSLTSMCTGWLLASLLLGPSAQEESADPEVEQETGQAGGQETPAPKPDPDLPQPSPPPASREQEPAPAPKQEKTGAETGESQSTSEATDPPQDVEVPVTQSATKASTAGGQVLQEVADALRAVERDRPDWARLETLGHSRGGRQIPLLTLTDLNTGSAMERPALLLIEETGVSAEGAEGLARLARLVIDRAASDPEVLALLQRAAILIAPLPDPDALADPATRGLSFARNFPLGWQPETLVEGAGLAPLEKAGVVAFTDLLRREGRLALVIGVSPEYRSGLPYIASELPLADGELFDLLGRIGRAQGALPWSRVASPGGGFLDIAYQAHGIPGLAFSLRPPAGSPGSSAALPSTAALGERLLGLVQALVARLPRLELSIDEPRRLGPGVWQIDLELRNPSPIPTLSSLAQARRVPAETQLTVTGATLIASAASRSFHTGVFDETNLHEPSDDLRLLLGAQAGGEVVRVRLIVSGETESTVQVRIDAPRAGSVTGRVLLLEPAAKD